MDILDIKVDAKVMLISNVRTSDSLVNGAMGVVTKIVSGSNGVKAIIVSFDNPEAGLEHCKDHQHFMEKHGLKDGVPIFKVVFEYSLSWSKGRKTHGCTGKIEQFPLRLAWASTAHKLQGQTIGEHSNLVAHGHSRMPKGMAYVMLSRCANFQSVYIDEQFDIDKIVCDDKALEATNDLVEKDILPSFQKLDFDFFMVNVRSLKHHLKDLEDDVFATKSKIVAVVETWLDPSKDNSITSTLGHYHSASLGKGAGCGAFLPNAGEQTLSTVHQKFQFLSVPIDQNSQVIVVYLSSDCTDYQDIIPHLQKHISLMPKSYLIGDFNFDKADNTVLAKFLTNLGFVQLISRPTHEKRRTIDHLYVQEQDKENIEIHYTYPYFTDHLAICVKLKK